jgi:hypothetical protein
VDALNVDKRLPVDPDALGATMSIKPEEFFLIGIGVIGGVLTLMAKGEVKK